MAAAETGCAGEKRRAAALVGIRCLAQCALIFSTFAWMRGDFRGWYPRKGADSTLKCDHAGGAGIQAIDLVGSFDFCKADLEAVDALA